MKAFAQLSSTCGTFPRGKPHVHEEQGCREDRELAPGAGWFLYVVAQGCLLADSSNIRGWPTPGSRGKETAEMPGAGGCSQPLGALSEYKDPSVPAIIQEERLFSPGWLWGGPGHWPGQCATK